tara:strand:- start:284 stop:586 length:303 start_codon:yes stop_codon:yes gene_type:complete
MKSKHTTEFYCGGEKTIVKRKAHCVICGQIFNKGDIAEQGVSFLSSNHYVGFSVYLCFNEVCNRFRHSKHMGHCEYTRVKMPGRKKVLRGRRKLGMFKRR